MIGFFPSLAALVIACLAISIVYALLSGQHPSRFGREIVVGFGLLFGGMVLLAGVIHVLPLLFGSG